MIPGPGLGRLSDLEVKEGSRVPASPPHQVAGEHVNLTGLPLPAL